jgi:hypothetical protein
MEDYENFLNDRQNLYDKSAHNILCPFYDRDKKHCFIILSDLYSFAEFYEIFQYQIMIFPGQCVYKKTTAIYNEKKPFKTVPYLGRLCKHSCRLQK